MDIVYTLSGLLQAGMTQTQIGDAIGVKQPTISDMANGKAGVKRPSSAVVIGLTELARQHGVPTDPPSAPAQSHHRRKTDNAPNSS